MADGLSPAASRARPDRIRRRSAAFAHLGDAQRCAVRSARTLAAPALLALALPAAAQAQTVTTLVSNIGQGQTRTFGSVAPRAQRFTTGSNAHGYLLSSVEVVSADTSSGRFGVRVCTTDTDGFPTSGFPTSTCPGLTPPRSFAAGTLSFSAPANLVLAQRTTYTVVLLSDAGIILYGSTLANGQDLGQADGWLIADAYDWADFNDYDAWLTVASGQAIRIAIKGTALSSPGVIGTAITSSPAANSSYVTGDVIHVTATFSSPVTVDTTSGTPRLALTIGLNTRYANYSVDDSTATEVVFAYPVTVSDHDQDGISIAANALELNGGAIHSQGDTSTNALLGHGAVSTQSGHRVNRRAVIVSGRVAVTSSPAANSSYVTGDVIEITAMFSEAVTVATASGTPRLALTIGSDTRYANYSSDSTATAVVFAYPVTANDHDQDGISIAANALELNGGAIHKPGDTNKNALLDHDAVSTQSGHRVNRRAVIVSGRVAVTSSPAANSSYVTGDVIEITAMFSEAVTVATASGTPRLALTIGSDTRYANYSADDSTATVVVFAYPVTANDHDQDGISIAANALELDGGAIHKPGHTNTSAVLDHRAVSTRSGHRVNRRAVIVSGAVTITSSPAANSSYVTGDVIQITATFSDAVTVSGTPRLALTIGSDTRYANYSAIDDTATAVVFAYPVTVDDHDQDGISIAANALELNGGAIHQPGHTNTNAVLDHGAVSRQSGHRVNRRAVIVSGGVAVTSSPAANSSYATGDVIEITATFSEAVTVDTASGTPLLPGRRRRGRRAGGGGGGRHAVAARRDDPHARGRGRRAGVHPHAGVPGQCAGAGGWGRRVDGGRHGAGGGQVHGSGGGCDHPAAELGGSGCG